MNLIRDDSRALRRRSTDGVHNIPVDHHPTYQDAPQAQPVDYLIDERADKTSSQHQQFMIYIAFIIGGSVVGYLAAISDLVLHLFSHATGIVLGVGIALLGIVAAFTAREK